MFFVIPEMSSKTFVMLYKKLPEHFKVAHFNPHTVCPGRSDPFYIVSYYIKWVITSWTVDIQKFKVIMHF